MKYKLRNNYSINPDEALIDILKDRGVKDVENFIKPSKKCELNPYDLDNIKETAERLLLHLRNNSRICFIQDPDVDGVTSSAILWLYIKNIFPNANLEFTIHEGKQHGLEDKIDWLIDEEQFDLIICADSASYDIEEHKRLHEIATDVICLDHHPPSEDKKTGELILPNSDWAYVVNNQLSPNYQNKSLCGAGIVYKFCEVLDDILGIQNAFNYIDLAALGEIADVMDKTNIETNYIMVEGLRNIKNKGFQTLLEAQSFSLKEKAIYPYENLTTIDIAFYIAPLINAIIRVGTYTEKENLFYCFIEPERPVKSTKRGAKEGDIELAAEATARCGSNAKSRQKRIQEKAIDIIDFKIQKNELDKNNIIFVELDADDDIPREMTGLIAMQIVSKYHKPVMLGRKNDLGEIQGSARSDNNFEGLPSFKEFLEQSGLVTYVAGHEGAFGHGVSESKLDALIEYANMHLNAEDFENCYIVDYILDASNDISQLLYSLASHPEYFGNHIDEIKVVIKNIELSSVMAMGANKDSMKISYNDVDYVRFKDIDFVEKILQNRMKKLTTLVRLNINEWMGKKSVQCFIDDYELEEDTHKYDF